MIIIKLQCVVCDKTDEVDLLKTRHLNMIHRSWWEYSISSKISNYFCWRQLKYQLTSLHLFWKHIKNVFPTSVCFKLNWIEKYTSTLIHMISFEVMFSIGFILIRSKYISIGFISITFQNPHSAWISNFFLPP